MRLYADEDFAYPVVVELRRLGHDVLTVQEDGLRSTADSAVLARADQLGRSVLTYNRRHFERLHAGGVAHCGILSATHDDDFPGLAARIHAKLSVLAAGRWCVRVNRSAKP